MSTSKAAAMTDSAASSSLADSTGLTPNDVKAKQSNRRRMFEDMEDQGAAAAAASARLARDRAYAAATAQAHHESRAAQFPAVDDEAYRGGPSRFQPGSMTGINALNLDTGPRPPPTTAATPAATAAFREPPGLGSTMGPTPAQLRKLPDQAQADRIALQCIPALAEQLRRNVTAAAAGISGPGPEQLRRNVTAAAAGISGPGPAARTWLAAKEEGCPQERLDELYKDVVKEIDQTYNNIMKDDARRPAKK